MLHITFSKYDCIILHKAYYLFTCTCVSINSFHSHSHSHIARSEFKFWKQNNMPRSGPVFHDMCIARARFKYALRQCRLDEQMIYSNLLANYMQCHDVNNFWKTISILI